MQKVKSLIKIVNERSNVIVQGEVCEFCHITLKNETAFAFIINSFGNHFLIPYQVFLHHFEPTE